MSKHVVISRHPAAIEFVRRHLATEGIDATHDASMSVIRLTAAADVDASFGEPGSVLDEIPVITGSAAPDQCRGKTVWGVVPLALAAVAADVRVIEFAAPPRGMEYTVDDMIRAGARIARYRVVADATIDMLA